MKSKGNMPRPSALALAAGLALLGVRAGGAINALKFVVAPEAPTALQAAPLASELEAGARGAMAELAQAYGQKLRGAFMKIVSDDFLGDAAALEDALLKDFRSYRAVNLDMILDTVTVFSDRILVVFHYNLTVVNDQGANNKFSGVSSFTFRWEKGKARLYQMAPPLIFGNSLSSAENPMASSQGTSATNSGSTPSGSSGSSGATSGSSEVSSSSTGAQTSGFIFSTQSETGSSSGADLFLSPTAAPCSGLPCLNAAAAGAIESIGSCDLGTLSSVSTSISAARATAVAGTCYAMKAADGRYAAIKVTSIVDLSPGTLVNFSYVYQPSGSNSFR